MYLIDTSVWVALLRQNSNLEMRERVANLIESGTAAWCPIVRAELLYGARRANERKRLNELASLLVELPMDDKVWGKAYQMIDASRGDGISVPISDILVFACARHHRAKILSDDKHFEMLASL